MSIEVSNLDHLGLVAGLVDEIGIVALINEQLGEHKAEKISAGQVVKGMILNGLGLVSSPLYLFSRFFSGKATEHLLGEGINAEYLNDDRLGRVLDSGFYSQENLQSSQSISWLSRVPLTVKAAQHRSSKVPNQLGRRTDRPTLRWIFQCFQSIHVLVVRQTVEISNLTDERLSLLKFFPPACQRYYLLS